MPWIDKEDLTSRELNTLQPTNWIVEGVNYKETKYYKTDNGQIWEYGLCVDGSLDKRMDEIKKVLKK